MIQLDKFEKQWILICKGHLKDKYPHKNSWHETLKPLFTEIYGWNPDVDNNYYDYLNCLFNLLLDLFLKIKDDNLNNHKQLKDIFFASFYKRVSCSEELPIERAIHQLCSMIQFTKVIDFDGNKRFEF